MNKKKVWVTLNENKIAFSEKQSIGEVEMFFNMFEDDSIDSLEPWLKIGLVYSPKYEVFYPVYVTKQSFIHA
jgi:hypothetical protein